MEEEERKKGERGLVKEGICESEMKKNWKTEDDLEHVEREGGGKGEGGGSRTSYTQAGL